MASYEELLQQENENARKHDAAARRRGNESSLKPKRPREDVIAETRQKQETKEEKKPATSEMK